MTYMIVGGSSGLGRELAERFAQAGHALLLISSDLRDTRALASDLALRYDVPVSSVQCDLANRAVDFQTIDSASCFARRKPDGRPLDLSERGH